VEFNVVDVSSSEKEIEVKLTYDEIKDDLDKQVKKESKKIQIPGFRKGKVPPNMLRKFYGDALEYEASEKVSNEWFWKIAEEQKLQPIGRPSMTDLQFEPGQDLTFKVKYEVIPDLELKDYKNLSFEVPEFIVKDDEVEGEIQYILESNHTTEIVDIVGDDDKFIIDVQATRLDKDGNLFPGSAPEKFHLHLNDQRVQQEIKDKARGKKVGDSFDFSFTNETGNQNEQDGQENFSEEFSYRFNILEIKKIIYPELNEELIRKVTKDKFSDVTEFRENIKKDIQNYYNERAEEIVRGKLISEIVKNNDFIPPSSLVANVLDEYVKSEEEKAKKNKLKPVDKDEVRNRLHKSAENEVKWYLIRNQIIKKEKLEVTEDELRELAQKDSEKTGLPVEKLINYYKSSNQSERSLDKKLFDYLKQNNKIVKVDPKKFNKKDEAVNE
jgi:trigger factor